MGILENLWESAKTTAQQWSGFTVAPLEEVTSLRESYGEMGFFLDEVEDMGALVMDYVGGRPHEVQAMHRRRLAQQSRIALIHDPTAGAEAQLRANFAFGRGITIPQAKDPDVQKVIDRAWKDPNNERKLTSYEAQRHRSNEMLTAANLFPTLFIQNGKVRVGFRDADDVADIVTDPEDDETPLWYVVRQRRTEWDYTTHQLRPVLGYEMENGTEKVWYVKHWRNVEDLEEWDRQTGESPPPHPPDANILDGLMEHFRINRIGRSQFGVPPWARTLRFYCHDDQTEALTAEGWMDLPEIKRRWAAGTMPKVAGYDGEQMLFEQPIDLNITPFDGEMMAFKTAKGFDMLVTPNHRMLDVKGGHVEAEQIIGMGRDRRPFSPVAAEVGGRQRVESFTLPAVRAREAYDTSRLRRLRKRQQHIKARVVAGERQADVARDLGLTKEYISGIVHGKYDRRSAGCELPERELPMDAWLAWLGWWISEGDSQMIVYQKLNGDRIGQIRDACEAMVMAGVEGTENIRHGYYRWRPRNPKQFKAWLADNCGLKAVNKRLPSFAFDLCADQARILLRALMAGDGTPTNWEADGWGRYYTASEQLAQDVQRLGLLCGYRATIGESDHPGRCRWEVRLSTTAERRLPQPVPTRYRGDVWCFTMPSDNLVTRRNGVMAISGNTALNQLTESQVQMRQGAATLVAQRIRRSGPRDLLKNVSQVMARTGEIAGRRRFAEGGPPSATGPGTLPGPREAAPPPPAGSWWEGSEQDRLEAINLRSGAGEALQDAQIVRAPIAAASGFGQHYLGDASSTTLAGATTLELPTLMDVSSWQETFEGIYRWFTDRVIEAAVHAGQLGGMVAESETFDNRPLHELRIREDRAEMEARTGKDLSYSFQMPYPGRRNLPDVMSAVSGMLITLDPMGRNMALREKMLDFAFRHGFQTEDPSADVEDVMKDVRRLVKEQIAQESQEREQQAKQFAAGFDAMSGANQAIPPSETGRETSEGPQYPGQKTRSRPPGLEMGGPGTRTREVLAEASYDPQALLNALMADARQAWDKGLGDPALLFSGRPSNGDSAPAAPPGQPGPLA